MGITIKKKQKQQQRNKCTIIYYSKAYSPSLLSP